MTRASRSRRGTAASAPSQRPQLAMLPVMSARRSSLPSPLRKARRCMARAACLILPSAAGAGPVLAQQLPDTATARPLGEVVISATRTSQAIRSLPAHVVVVGAPALATTTAQTVPDLLRSIPGFTTRDFQAGLVSGPSQSIISFRGLGGSSAGRALVLLDGIPAGDPFSGWLDWGRIPLPMLESAEVVRGGGSPIWGSRSLAGVVNLRTIAPRGDEARLVIEGGSLGTRRGAGSMSLRRGRLSATVGGDAWQTDGFVVLRADQAGPADIPDSRASRALSGRATWDASHAVQLWLGGATYAGGQHPLGVEDRQDFDEGRGGARWVSPGGGIATVTAFSNRRSTFGRSWSINSARTTRTPQRTNASPARSSGLSLQWTQLALERHELTVGADLSAATGSLVEEYAYVAREATRERDVGGTQQLGGVFIQDAATLRPDLRLVASLRADRVRNDEGRRIVRDVTTGTTLSDSTLTGLSTNRLTWSIGLRWQAREWLGWRASTYEGFRAPSMYEMYHPRFSSRGTVTEANASLDAERLRGAELGADVTVATGFIARATLFLNRVTSPIMDYTVGTAGDQAEVIAPCGLMPARQTCSQRRNVDALRSHGLETEVEWRPRRAVSLRAGYSYSPTRVSAPGQAVDGKRAIRSATHAVNGNLSWDVPVVAMVALDARHVGSRYDDDLNQVKLDGFSVLGVRVDRPLGRGMTAHLKVENALDKAFEVARTRSGLADMGAPRWVTLGVRAIW